MLHTTTLSTPLGEMTALYQAQGILLFDFTDSCVNDYTKLEQQYGKATKHENPISQALKTQIAQYFSGTRHTFQLPLAPQGTPFQQKVWQILRTIPYGKTISYLEQAESMGNHKAVRAVAAANSRNPLSIIVPCHRVIGKNGKLTGYAGGIARKAALLQLEQQYRDKLSIQNQQLHQNA